MSILFPKEFTFVNGPLHNDFVTALVASFGTTPTVTTSSTPEGTLVTLSNFIKYGDVQFQTALRATTDAAADDGSVGAKIWIHNVGTPWTADPSVTALIDANSPNEGTDWFPVFCECGTEEMNIDPDVIKTVTVAADKNRAKGYTALVASAVDQYGNDVSSYATYGVPTVTGSAADNASVTFYDTGEWIWRLADTPGTNRATVVVDDSRTAVTETITNFTEFSNLGFGEPAKVVILPAKTAFLPGDSPSVQIQLQDAAGNPTSWLDEHASGGPTQDWFEVVASSMNNPFPGGQATTNRYIWRGWSKASPYISGPDANAWPQSFGFGMTAEGPDTWTFSAKHRSGSVVPAAFVSSDILAADPDLRRRG